MTRPREIRYGNLIAWLAPLLLYAGMVVPISVRQRHAINPDGIIYIRKAQLLLAGHFHDSISGYWSPAISWCVALVLKLSPNANPLSVIHGVLAFWGGTWVLASIAFLSVIVRGTANRQIATRTIAGIALALAAVRQAVFLITPDLLLGTMLMTYLTWAAMPGLLQRRRTPFFAGLAAGIGYLCKSYALPFFVLHFPLTVAYRIWSQRRGRSWSDQPDVDSVPIISLRQALVPLAIGFVGFLLPAAPWVATLSQKYGHFTISMVVHHNHINVAPESFLKQAPDFCVIPPDPYLSIWEGLDPGPRVLDWSPFASMTFFRHQVWIANNHLGLIIREIFRFDRLGLSLLAAAIGLLSLSRSWMGRPTAVPAWIVLTGMAYCTGFLLVAFEVRYIVPILLPLAISLCVRQWNELSVTWPTRQPWMTCVPIAIAVLFALSARRAVWEYVTDSGPEPIYANVARAMHHAKLTGLFTSSDNNKGVDVAYFLNRKIVLMPSRDDTAAIQRSLAAARVRTILIWTDNRAPQADSYPVRLTRMLLATHRWKRVLSLKLDSARRVDIYERARFVAHPPTTTAPRPTTTNSAP